MQKEICYKVFYKQIMFTLKSDRWKEEKLRVICIKVHGSSKYYEIWHERNKMIDAIWTSIFLYFTLKYTHFYSAPYSHNLRGAGHRCINNDCYAGHGTTSKIKPGTCHDCKSDALSTPLSIKLRLGQRDRVCVLATDVQRHCRREVHSCWFLTHGTPSCHVTRRPGQSAWHGAAGSARARTADDETSVQWRSTRRSWWSDWRT